MTGRTREECIAAAGRAHAAAIERLDSLSPRQAALEAYEPGVTPSVDELEALIRADREQWSDDPTDTSQPAG